MRLAARSPTVLILTIVAVVTMTAGGPNAFITRRRCGGNQ